MGRRSALLSAFWREGDKSQGLGAESPQVNKENNQFEAACVSGNPRSTRNTAQFLLKVYSQNMGTRLLLMLSVAWLCSGECVQVGPPQFGRVEVSAFSILGERLPILGIDLIEFGTHKSLKSRLNGAVATKVPYGTYLVRVSAPGFRRSEREIHLDQPEVLVRMQLAVAVECSSSFAEIRGILRHAPPDRELWVKLVPLQGVGGAEVRISQNGSFLAGGLDEGQYLLLVLDGKAVVHTGNLVIPASTPVDIDLARN
jgi:hypothetical protein